jgi:hypothetical protein
MRARRFRQLATATTAIALFVALCRAQDNNPQIPVKKADEQINVNWLYGSYVPKDVPLRALTNDERIKLYVRQSFTTPGMYIKTALFSIGDQINDSPPAWGGGFEGYGRRFASRQGQFVVQNSFSALGNAILAYEPRYDRCRCSGFWRRTRHALLRDFFTYNRKGAAAPGGGLRCSLRGRSRCRYVEAT